MSRNLAEALPEQQARVRDIRAEYAKLRGVPGVNVEFAIASMDASLNAAEKAAAEGDVIAMIQAYKDLEEYKL